MGETQRSLKAALLSWLRKLGRVYLLEVHISYADNLHDLQKDLARRGRCQVH